MKLLRAMWTILDRQQRRSLMRLSCVTLLMAATTVAALAAVMPFFALLANSESAALGWLQILGFTFLGLVLISNLVNLAGSIALNRFAHRTGDQFRAALFAEYLRRDYAFHLRNNGSILSNHIIWEVSRGVTAILQSLFTLTASAMTAAFILASVVYVSPGIALAAFAGLAGSYCAFYLLTRRRLVRNGLVETAQNNERAKTVNQTFAGIREVALSRSQAFFTRKLTVASAEISRTAVSTHAIAQGPRYLLECVMVGGLVATALYLTSREPPQRDWLARLSFIGFAAYRLLPALQQIFHSLVRIRADRGAFESLASELAAAQGPADVAAPAQRQSRSWREIRFTDVSFAYDPARGNAVHGISLSIQRGACIGLVGASGSGKTTIADLLVGLLAPTQGVITVDDAMLGGDTVAGWRDTIGYVGQQSYLFDASVAENVALAERADEIDFARLSHALRLANLDELVASLPHGVNELLGERGARLSGGQRQRIGIARALYRHTSLLVLDESTNALDRPTEGEIMATLRRLRHTHTVVLIAHRMSTVCGCDRIFEIERGRVVNCGTYEELRAVSARFRALADGT